MQDFSPTADIENEIKTVISDDNFSGENGEILGLKNPKKVRGEFVASEGSSRALVIQDAVLLGLLEEARYTGEGSSHSARVAAWAHIGKHLGMFIERVHATLILRGVLSKRR